MRNSSPSAWAAGGGDAQVLGPARRQVLHPSLGTSKSQITDRDSGERPGAQRAV